MLHLVLRLLPQIIARFLHHISIVETNKHLLDSWEIRQLSQQVLLFKSSITSLISELNMNSLAQNYQVK
uniref:Auxin response factor n=1 Tax=Rhizophora mucronata TaxID=61149 RepID=A0A2P2PU89_RHIMU